jgi:branched-chain amino acid transport system substrate-binding protein
VRFESLLRLRLVTLALAELCLAACASPQPQRVQVVVPDARPAPEAPAAPREPWRVGAFVPLTGIDAAFGVDMKQGIDLAVDQINRGGGAKGRPISVYYVDDESRPELAARAVTSLIERDHVIALLGEVAASRTRAAAVVANKLHVPVISPSATNPELNATGPFFFRTCVDDDVQGRLGASLLIETLQKKRIAILTSDSLYSTGLARAFAGEVARLGGAVVAEQSFKRTESDLAPALSVLWKAQPDAIYVPVYERVVEIAKAARALGIPGSALLGSDGWDDDRLWVDDLEGALFTNHFAADAPGYNAKFFNASFRERYHLVPSVLDAEAYDATRILASALSRATAETPEAIRDAVASTQDEETTRGKISLDSSRLAHVPMAVLRIQHHRASFHSFIGPRLR